MCFLQLHKLLVSPLGSIASLEAGRLRSFLQHGSILERNFPNGISSIRADSPLLFSILSRSLLNTPTPQTIITTHHASTNRATGPTASRPCQHRIADRIKHRRDLIPQGKVDGISRAGSVISNILQNTQRNISRRLDSLQESQQNLLKKLNAIKSENYIQEINSLKAEKQLLQTNSGVFAGEDAPHSTPCVLCQIPCSSPLTCWQYS